MEFVIMLAALAGFAVFIIGLEAYRARKREKEYIKSLYDEYDKLAEKKYSPERFQRMGSFFERHRQDGQLDDITWNDLGMDEIFKRMNYTMSASGEEYLYYMLRTLKQDRESLLHFEEVVECIGQNPDERVRLQYKLHQLGYTGKYSLYEYIENLDYLGERSVRKHLIPDLLFLPAIGMLWVNFSFGIVGIIGLIIYNIISYFSEKGEIEPYITSFAYILRLLEACGELEKLKLPGCRQELECIREHREKMQSMCRGAFWVMAAGNGSNLASGDILGVLLDYVRMIFHVDLIKFAGMLKTLREHMEDIDALIGTVGYLETATAVWIFRQTLDNGWCLPEFADENDGIGIEINQGYHPLISMPVKNSIIARNGVLLTGSNASGKSTFLKTVAVNAILSQSVNTCTGDSYRAPFYHVYSSMALRDNLESGESYYIVEIKALKRILDAVSKQQRVLCFVDEVLRGTNTVERIAASTQILKALNNKGAMCFAATHDIELTGLLEREFDNYHFEEEIRDGDIFFNYRLMKGRASTRNAIKLLELLGYEDEIIKMASARAEHFLETGEWDFA
ncbi:MAG: hypothetical protein ACI4HQ_10785 [Acetatifactor sp.]